MSYLMAAAMANFVVFLNSQQAYDGQRDFSDYESNVTRYATYLT